MLRGDFEAAWRETDRLELPRRLAARSAGFVRQPHHLVWNGEPFVGKRVLVRCEHGLGDSLQYLRYTPRLREIAPHVTLCVQPALLRLFRGTRGADTIVDAWATEPEPPHDVVVECMELAYAFRDHMGSLPRPAYLPVDRLLALPKIPGIRGKFKVGIVWAASDWDATRSLPLQSFGPLFETPGIRFYSLQQGAAGEELSNSDLPLTPLSEFTKDVAEAARAILQLDLVVTVDGMIAHLAGSLGVPVWLLLKANADWRWMEKTQRSVWYPSMRIFRRAPTDRNWNFAVREMSNALGRISELAGSF
jgi:hypothetical protein